MATLDEYILKVTLIGSHNTGKTTLVQRICGGGMKNGAGGQENGPGRIGDTRPTVGVEFSARIIRNLRPNTLVRLQMWDTAGTEKYAAIAGPVFRNAGGIIAVCDVTNAESLDALITKWLPMAFAHLPTLPLTSVLVVCNKCDLVGVGHKGAEGEEVVAAFSSTEASEALEAAGFKGCLVMEASGLTGANVESAVSLMCNRIIGKFADVPLGSTTSATPSAPVGAAMPKGATASAKGEPASPIGLGGASKGAAKAGGSNSDLDDDDGAKGRRSASTLPPTSAAASGTKVSLDDSQANKGKDGEKKPKSSCPC